MTFPCVLPWHAQLVSFCDFSVSFAMAIGVVSSDHGGHGHGEGGGGEGAGRRDPGQPFDNKAGLAIRNDPR